MAVFFKRTWFAPEAECLQVEDLQLHARLLHRLLQDVLLKRLAQKADAALPQHRYPYVTGSSNAQNA